MQCIMNLFDAFNVIILFDYFSVINHHRGRAVVQW